MVNIAAYQVAAPGSTPGRRNIFFTFRITPSHVPVDLKQQFLTIVNCINYRFFKKGDVCKEQES